MIRQRAMNPSHCYVRTMIVSLKGEKLHFSSQRFPSLTLVILLPHDSQHKSNDHHSHLPHLLNSPLLNIPIDMKYCIPKWRILKGVENTNKSVLGMKRLMYSVSMIESRFLTFHMTESFFEKALFTHDNLVPSRVLTTDRQSPLLPSLWYF